MNFININWEGWNNEGQIIIQDHDLFIMIAHKKFDIVWLKLIC